MANPLTRTQAEAELSKSVEQLLHKNITSEEAGFISEMVKGVEVDVAGKVICNCFSYRISFFSDLFPSI